VAVVVGRNKLEHMMGGMLALGRPLEQPSFGVHNILVGRMLGHILAS